MAPLIVVAGNTGAGKTTLTQALCKLYPFTTGLEQHAERPFQTLMKHDPTRFALPNQLDYLLFRAEQEFALRRKDGVGILDGGLDVDFYGFTQLFRDKGYLTTGEFALVERLYRQQRQLLGPPDLILRLVAPLDAVTERYVRRGRPLEIAEQADITALGQLLDAWLDTVPAANSLNVDMGTSHALTVPALQALLAQILERIGN